MVVGAIGQAVRGERGFMTKQLNVVDHKIKLFKAPLLPPRRRKTHLVAHQEIRPYRIKCRILILNWYYW